ncbi:MAG TPA: hypothetical protein VJT49_28950 [Amycolatopsis sp.]|uniref:hypothetical protein n=1 Tax=Amycolatopsis sp. TaxID=37632 RepID=UPI002B4A5DD5|nr:hypothetical protein [Amycolatopsis sp.]HKS49066.1 hypothetical protein [Amycolatopsis sp.]
MGVPGPALLAAVGAAAVVLGGCKTQEVEVRSTVVKSTSDPDPGARPTSTPRSTKSVRAEAGPEEESDPPRPAASAERAGRGCGTVHAASGPNLEVLEISLSGVDCAEARRLVTEFHARVAGRHHAGSRAVSVSVHGWLCESSSRGGFTCTRQGNSVRARTVPH